MLARPVMIAQCASSAGAAHGNARHIAQNVRNNPGLALLQRFAVQYRHRRTELVYGHGLTGP